MKILSIDTSNSICSICISENSDIIDYKIDEKTSSQAENLFPFIEDLLASNNLTYSDIDLITTSRGPGSFTGIRVGLAAVKGMSLVMNAKIIGITNLEAIAYGMRDNFKNNYPIAVALDARRNQSYLQVFSQDIKALTEGKLIRVEDIEQEIDIPSCNLAAEDTLEISHLEVSYFNVIKTKNINALTLAKAATFFREKLENQTIEPLYIRPPDAKSLAERSASK